MPCDRRSVVNTAGRLALPLTPVAEGDSPRREPCRRVRLSKGQAVRGPTAPASGGDYLPQLHLVQRPVQVAGRVVPPPPPPPQNPPRASAGGRRPPGERKSHRLHMVKAPSSPPMPSSAC